ncbi:Bacterial DNA polymerase III, alpha subunit domain protein, partial [mine drainage metagenome]
QEIGITLERALESGDLRDAGAADEQVQQLLDYARQLEGAPRHASVHAAGVVIAPSPVWEHVPLQKMQDGSIVTQFPMTTLEELGLLKMDFLGLRTLTVVSEARRLAAAEGGPVAAMADLPPDDAKTFAMLSAGDTWGVFQLESAGMTDMLREMKPNHVEDIIAAVSLYRPGPME